MPTFPSHVTDALGGRHRLVDQPLGRGGQGIVFRARSSPGLAVKLLPRHRTDLLDRLAAVRALPLPDDLPVARPLAALQDRIGYTMTLMTDMAPIQTLLHAPADGPLADFYLQTGGLRKRLRVLARTAGTLARLHAIPVVYVDLSATNVFVSEDPDHDQVWLIDADNLDFDTERAPSIHTPGYGAPEVVRGGSPTTLSDAYAFAILAFQVLAQHHPFLGARAESGGWDSDTDDGETLAFAGDLPWIFDPDDSSNAADLGLPPDIVLSPGLRALFTQSFGAGRDDRALRPGLTAWTEALRLAADQTVACPACGSTFYLARRCPWCDGGDRSAPRFLSLVARRWDPTLEEPAEWAPTYFQVWRLLLDLPTPDCPAVVPRHVTRATVVADADEPALELRAVRGGLQLSPLDDGEYSVVGRDGTLVPMRGPLQLPLPTPGKEWAVHCGPLDAPHRFLTVSAALP